ncbi:MAG TPA: hypothetical protein VKR53_19540 [Puia sp.]|nr:hypothetical protein [Puia sp.]
MLFQKQKQFSTTIRANGRQKEFNFLKVNSASIPTYHIDVSDERGNRHYFSLVLAEDHWAISGGVAVPEWIRNAEKLLETTVLEYEKPGAVNDYR